MHIAVGSYTLGALKARDPSEFVANKNYLTDAKTKKQYIDNSIDQILNESIEKSLEGDGETNYDGENSFAGISRKVKRH